MGFDLEWDIEGITRPRQSWKRPVDQRRLSGLLLGKTYNMEENNDAEKSDLCMGVLQDLVCFNPCLFLESNGIGFNLSRIGDQEHKSANLGHHIGETCPTSGIHDLFSHLILLFENLLSFFTANRRFLVHIFIVNARFKLLIGVHVNAILAVD